MDLNPKELNLEAYLRTLASSRQGLVVKVGYAGWPDDILVLPGGRQGWIELKRWRHGPVPLQLQRLEELRQRGVIAVWACTKGEVLSFVQQVEASR